MSHVDEPTTPATPANVPQPRLAPDATANLNGVGAQLQIDVYFGALLALASYANYDGVIAALNDRDSTPDLVQAAFETALIELGSDFTTEEVAYLSSRLEIRAAADPAITFFNDDAIVLFRDRLTNEQFVSFAGTNGPGDIPDDVAVAVGDVAGAVSDDNAIYRHWVEDGLISLTDPLSFFGHSLGAHRAQGLARTHFIEGRPLGIVFGYDAPGFPADSYATGDGVFFSGVEIPVDLADLFAATVFITNASGRSLTSIVVPPYKSPFNIASSAFSPLKNWRRFLMTAKDCSIGLKSGE